MPQLAVKQTHITSFLSSLLIISIRGERAYNEMQLEGRHICKNVMDVSHFPTMHHHHPTPYPITSNLFFCSSFEDIFLKRRRYCFHYKKRSSLLLSNVPWMSSTWQAVWDEKPIHLWCMYIKRGRRGREERKEVQSIRAVDVTYARTYEVIGVQVFNVVDNANVINDCWHSTLVLNTPFSYPSSPSCPSSLSSRKMSYICFSPTLPSLL